MPAEKANGKTATQEKQSIVQKSVTLPLEKETKGTWKFGKKEALDGQDLSLYWPKELLPSGFTPSEMEINVTIRAK